MKKLLLLLSSVASIGLLSAQSPLQQNKLKDPVLLKQPGEIVKIKAKNSSSKRTVVDPTWTSIAQTLVDDGKATNAEYSYTTIFPDTNALFTYRGTSGTVTFETNINSVGVVFDMRSDNLYGVVGPYVASNFTITKVDSVRINYFYRRFNSNVNMVDTLIVTTFDRTSITRNFGVNSYYSAVDYTTNQLTASGSGAIKITVPLTAADSGAGSITLPVNRVISGTAAQGKWFGATVTYFPGYKGYNHLLPFDTVADFNTSKVGPNLVNTMRILSLYQTGKYVEPGLAPINGSAKYNHGIVAEPAQRYKLQNPARDYYYPADYTTTSMFPAIEFLISTNNLAIKNTNKEVSLLNAYPNPASANSEVVLSLNSLKNTSAIVTITDISGKVINSMNTEIANGKNNIILSTNALSNGLYIITVKGGDFISSSKLIIE